MMSTETPNTVEEDLKGIMNDLPVPVAIVTAAFGSEKRAVTISSFTSHSMRPALVTFNIDCTTQFCSIIKKASHFAVHFPSLRHADLCRQFARKGLSSEEQFRGVDFFDNEYGSPVIKSIASAIYCSLNDVIEVGDHLILVGRVLQAYKSDVDPQLLYHQRSFVTLQQGDG